MHVKISQVYLHQVEMNSGLQFHDGISTQEIQQILIKSTDLISLEKTLETINMWQPITFIQSKKTIKQKTLGHTHIRTSTKGY